MSVEQAGNGERKTNLLLCLVTSARPFRDNVLLSLGVGRKGESDTGEGGTLSQHS